MRWALPLLNPKPSPIPPPTNHARPGASPLPSHHRLTAEVLLLTRILESALHTIEEGVMLSSRFKFRETYVVRGIKTQADRVQAWLRKLKQVTKELRWGLPLLSTEVAPTP
jgi:hypothetical protein